MANTFKALVDYAEWDKATKKPEDKKEQGAEKKIGSAGKIVPPNEEIEEDDFSVKLPKTQLHYNIQIHLPESRDPAVYDALFKSLKKHLF